MSAVTRRLRRDVAKGTSNRQRQRNAEYAMRTGMRSYMIALVMLLHSGGSMTIDAALIDKVNLNMEFETVDHPDDPTKKIIRMIVSDDAPVKMPAVD